MIAVVADDFTGAAELAAIGLRYGLSAEVQTALNSDSRADLVVIDTNIHPRPYFQERADIFARLQPWPGK